MRIIGTILLVALPFLSAAIPIESEKGIVIPLTRRHAFIDEHGYAQLDLVGAHLDHHTDMIIEGLEAYKRNTGSEHPTLFVDPSHSTLGKRASRSSSGTGLITPNNMVWFGAFSVGTPPQPFVLDVSAANAMTMIPGKECLTGNCLNHTLYDPDESTTSKYLKGTFMMRTGDNSTTTGQMYSDNVSVGRLTVKNQTVAVASTMNSGYNFTRFMGDGNLGIGFSAISPINATSFFDNLVLQGLLEQNLFSLKINTTGSELRFGAVDEKLRTGPYTDVPLGKKAYWEVIVDSFVVDDDEGITNVTAIIDPSVTYIITPNTTASAIYQHIPGARYAPEVGSGLWTYPCDADFEVGVQFGSRIFYIVPKYFNRGKLADDEDSCVGGITTRVGIKFVILGDVFLMGAQVYTVFDAAGNRMRFAKLAQSA